MLSQKFFILCFWEFPRIMGCQFILSSAYVIIKEDLLCKSSFIPGTLAKIIFIHLVRSTVFYSLSQSVKLPRHQHIYKSFLFMPYFLYLLYAVLYGIFNISESSTSVIIFPLYLIITLLRLFLQFSFCEIHLQFCGE